VSATTTTTATSATPIPVSELLSAVSYGQLAKRAGCTKAALSLIFTGQRTPTVELVGKIAEALGCETPALLKHLGLTPGRRHNWMGELRTTTVRVGRRKAA
jgi:transcriptional regulator with XRE-family HTH domain